MNGRLADDVPASGAGEHPVDIDAGEIDVEDFDAGPHVDVDFEVELRDEIDDRVELEAALERGDADVAPHAHRRSALHGRGRDREVALELHADDADREL